MSIHKAEYVIQLDKNICDGCGNCILKCPFKAIEKGDFRNNIKIDLNKCYGCGVCRHICPQEALSLYPRDLIPQVCGKY